MKNLIPLPRILALALIVAASAALVSAQKPAANSPLAKLLDQIEIGFGNRTLAELDAQPRYIGRFRIVIEHSLIDPTEAGAFEVRSFKRFAAAQRWLQKRESPNEGNPTPFPAIRPLKKCRKGLCTYDFDGGIDHNHLYLQKVGYGIRNGKAYLKTIYLYDGD
ncbi:MAG: hypothetical protein ABIP75_05660 [Pyrinomonadaceae bacterium]